MRHPQSVKLLVGVSLEAVCKRWWSFPASKRSRLDSRFHWKDGDFTGGFQFLIRLGLFLDSRPVSEHGVTFCCGMTARGVRQDELKAT